MAKKTKKTKKVKKSGGKTKKVKKRAAVSDAEVVRRPFPKPKVVDLRYEDLGRRYELAVRKAEARGRILDPAVDTRDRIRGIAPKGGPVTRPPKKKNKPPKTGKLVNAKVQVKGYTVKSYTVKPHTRTMKVRVGQGVS